jgi:aspartyl-tRNA synthetase
VTGLAVHDKDTVPTANLSTLLDNPVIRKRAPVDRAIQDIRNEVQYLFMEYLRARGFKKFEAPGLIATASEGGANVFELPYFGKSAYLARKLTSFSSRSKKIISSSVSRLTSSLVVTTTSIP